MPSVVRWRTCPFLAGAKARNEEQSLMLSTTSTVAHAYAPLSIHVRLPRRAIVSDDDHTRCAGLRGQAFSLKASRYLFGGRRGGCSILLRPGVDVVHTTRVNAIGILRQLL